MVPVLGLLAGCAGQRAFPDMIPTRTLESLQVVSKVEDRSRGHREFDLVAECMKAKNAGDRSVMLPAGRYQVKAKWRDDFITGNDGQYVGAEVRIGDEGQVIQPVDSFDPSGAFIDVAPENADKAGNRITIVLKWRFVGRDDEGNFLYNDDDSPALMEGDNVVTCTLVGKPIGVFLGVDVTPPEGMAAVRGIPEGEHVLAFSESDECADAAWTDRPQDQFPAWNAYFGENQPLPRVRVKGSRFDLAFRCDKSLPLVNFRYDVHRVACNRDGVCDPGESFAKCPQDNCARPVCNSNGICEPGETFRKCPADNCAPPREPVAPSPCNRNGVCDPGETQALCPADNCRTGTLKDTIGGGGVIDLKQINMCSGTGPLPRPLTSFTPQGGEPPALVCAQDTFSCMVSEAGRLFEVKPRATYRAKAFTKYRLEKCK
jgi:hypothetical protein